MPGKLEEIDIDETSGVDHPATLVEGWMVMKSAEQLEGEIERILAEAEDFQKMHGQLLSALESAASGYLAEAPDDVKAASNRLHDYLKELPADGDDEKEASAEKTETKKDGSFIAKVLTRFFQTRHQAELEATRQTEAKFEKSWAAVEQEVAGLVGTDRQARRQAIAKAVVTHLVTEGEEDEVKEYIERIAKAIDEAFEAKEKENEAAAAAAAAAPAPAPEPAPQPTPAPAAPAEDENKPKDETHGYASQEDLDAAREALSKALDRIEALEKRSATRTSVDGEETPVEKSAGDSQYFGGMVRRALAGQKVTIGVAE